MPHREEDIDHICMYCGRVSAGPHKGLRMHIPKDYHDMPTTYYGAPISHAGCDPACKEQRAAMTKPKEAPKTRTVGDIAPRKPGGKNNPHHVTQERPAPQRSYPVHPEPRKARTVGPIAPRKPGGKNSAKKREK